MEKKGICCICGDIYDNYGNNPEGAAWKTESGEIVFPEFDIINDRCCNDCNEKFVIPGRIYSMYANKEESK